MEYVVHLIGSTMKQVTVKIEGTEPQCMATMQKAQVVTECGQIMHMEVNVPGRESQCQRLSINIWTLNDALIKAGLAEAGDRVASGIEGIDNAFKYCTKLIRVETLVTKKKDSEEDENVDYEPESTTVDGDPSDDILDDGNDEDVESTETAEER